MKTVIRDGVEYEERPVKVMPNGSLIVKLIPLPKPKKTLVEVFASESGDSEEYVRKYKPGTTSALDAIEERLAKLEQRDAKLEEK